MINRLCVKERVHSEVAAVGGLVTGIPYFKSTSRAILFIFLASHHHQKLSTKRMHKLNTRAHGQDEAN
jgi:hypothetical protein